MKPNSEGSVFISNFKAWLWEEKRKKKEKKRSNFISIHLSILPSHPLLMPALFVMSGPVNARAMRGLSNWCHGSVVSWLWSGPSFNNHYRPCRVVRLAISAAIGQKKKKKNQIKSQMCSWKSSNHESTLH